jgi:pyruvate/2-oxoglutarate dehydrogenase complex dihydrolipoamide acyltransferase (E2) component
MYLHLSSVAVRVGQRVSQGDVLGRVGSSGLSTGPHLDYRLRKNGAYVNPLTEHRRMPPGDPIPASLMAAFAVERDKANSLLTAAGANPPAAPTGPAIPPSGAAPPAARQGTTPVRWTLGRRRSPTYLLRIRSKNSAVA